MAGGEVVGIGEVEEEESWGNEEGEKGRQYRANSLSFTLSAVGESGVLFRIDQLKFQLGHEVSARSTEWYKLVAVEPILKAAIKYPGLSFHSIASYQIRSSAPVNLNRYLHQIPKKPRYKQSYGAV
ncbi:hypothetical protein J3459_022388 [Metarhizium acridum]|nr:hypothetical protein J3459_022388 [Metarhizium acridum]